MVLVVVGRLQEEDERVVRDFCGAAVFCRFLGVGVLFINGIFYKILDFFHNDVSSNKEAESIHSFLLFFFYLKM